MMARRSSVPADEAIFESCFTRLGVPVFFTIDVAPVPEVPAEILVPDEKLVYTLVAQVVAQAPDVRDVHVLALDRNEKFHRALESQVSRVIEMGVGTAETDFEEAFGGLTQPGSIMIIDSLTTLLHLVGLQRVAAQVINSRRVDGFIGIVALWRSSSHVEPVRSALYTLCTSALLFSVPRIPNAHDRHSEFVPVVGIRSGLLQLIRKKASGRTATSQLKVTLTEQEQLRFGSPGADYTEGKRQLQETVRQPQDPLKDLELPFNLTLTEDERRARSQVTLAYEHEDEARANMSLDLHPEQLQADYIDDPEQSSEDDVDV
eukprot:Plantae.Rhodophyta-Purpureofilum_apyrenoidigerum.ctg15431.p1 GENE.Plantae.Rhodophyta-Purpureofilum_apyrenoidigerum.ctg15431~~Plantae.Rhodophyta-Purpureofilum_apyrenoidigerum.ctg15431.p1  ORF type:complete len:318 (+),score=57.50 Plantae.Rhodophyta-Purpureofilum_apyrenoidigerum.ctg15431:60-1013(+)